MADLVLDEVLRLLDVADHPSSPHAIRRQLPTLRRQAVHSPTRAHELLRLRARPILDALPRHPATQILYRVQQVEVFLQKCTRDEYRYSMDALTFRQLVEAAPDPDGFLSQTLARGRIVFPREHSWMVAANDAILSVSGTELRAMLRMELQRPPFVLCTLPVSLLDAAAITVRAPTGADAAVGRHDYWRSNDLPAGPEFIDLDIPGSALAEVLWRP